MQVINIKAQTTQFTKELNALERLHIPFAVAMGLTKTAIEARDAVREKTRTTFRLHTDFIPKGVKHQNASIDGMRTVGHTEAAIFTAPLISKFMPLHETSGLKTPRGKALTIPGSGFDDTNFKTGSGKVKKQFQPKKLLERFNRQKTGKKVGKGKSKSAFIIKSRRTGTAMIVRRRTDKSYPLETLYILEPKAKINKTWEFFETVAMIVAMRLMPNMRNAFLASRAFR